jgi:cytochrome d ubiquinol oxidase subunit I
MVGAGVWMLLLMVLGFWFNARRTIQNHRWLLWLFVLSIPVPWLAVETGWFVAEFGRQPWAIGEVLPTAIAASSLTATDLRISLGGFLVFYTILFLIEMFLMFKFGRMGPSALHTGKYHHERPAAGPDEGRDGPRGGHGGGTVPATAPQRNEP